MINLRMCVVPDPSERSPRPRGLLKIGAMVVCLALACTVAQGSGLLAMEKSLEPDPRFAANEAEFASRRDAEDYLTRMLPLATSENPKYLTKSEGAETEWRTKSIRFEDLPAGRGIQVSMDEEFTQVRAGVRSVGTHQAIFSLSEVEISPLTQTGDVTPSGEPARGVLFTCRLGAKCVRATWDGQASSADRTDISIQDAAVRAKILAAFVFLKGQSGEGKSPT
jgi:hypothetical protein